MLTRTTVSLNRDYLKTLKLLAIKQQKSLSGLINEAVRVYLSGTREKSDNSLFFKSLVDIKDDLDLSKDKLLKYVRKGRI